MERRLDGGEGCGDDLDVEDRHEHPDAHQDETDPLTISGGLRFATVQVAPIIHTRATPSTLVSLARSLLDKGNS